MKRNGRWSVKNHPAYFPGRRSRVGVKDVSYVEKVREAEWGGKESMTSDAERRAEPRMRPIRTRIRM